MATRAAEGMKQDAAGLIASARRITIKIGSSLLIDAEGGGPRREWLSSLADDLSALRSAGKQLVAVSSGAVALGRQHLGLRRSPRLDLKQAAAAAGQPLLMQAWEQALAPHGIPSAQLLLTLGDTESRRRWLNARATMDVLLAQGALPIVNENDSVATEELRYGDNDRLSARVAQMMCSDLLILLSDVDGVYTADPSRDPTAQHLAAIDTISPEVEGYAAGAAVGGVGTGGMATKLAAARIAQGFGCHTVIASGREDRPIMRLAGGARSTVILTAGSPAGAYKQWIAGALAPAGALVVDAGAARALSSGKSLLPAGVIAVEGQFGKGECLRILGPDRNEIGRGLARYPAAEAQAIAGLPSDLIEERLGYAGPDVLIHRDDMVLM
jgi:glutamate 5-kinase